MANPWEMGLSVDETLPWERGLTTESAKHRGLDVVKTTQNGGMVLRGPDGQLMFLDEQAGFSSADPEFVAKVMQGEDPAAMSSSGYFADVMKEVPFEAAQRQKVAEGIPFVGSWLDEITGAVGGESAQANVRLASRAMEEQNPVASAVSKATGTLAAAVPLAAATPAMPALSALPTAQRIAAYTGLGALGGGIEGGIYGAGEDQALRGAVGGAIGGGLGGLATPLIGMGVENIVKLAQRTDIPNISAALGVSKDAAKVIKATFAEAGGSMRDAIRNIRKAGDLGMVADADTATAILLDAAAASGGKAATLTNKAVTARAKQESANLGGYLDESLATVPKMGTVNADVQDIAEGLSKSTAGARRDAYNEAYSTPINYADDTGRNIEAILQTRIPSRYLNSAIQRANERMMANNMPNQQIMADIAEDGSVTFREMPNVQQLDEIKKSLGEVAFGQIDSLGRPTAEALDALKLYKLLRRSIGDAVPAYNKAMDIASDKISLDNALETGEKLLTPKITVREASRRLAGSTESERNVAKLGARTYIQEAIDNVKASVTSPDVDINQLRKTLTDLSSDASKKKLAILLGTKETQVLYKNLEKAKAALALRAAVAVNSKTAVRQRVQEQVDDLTQVGAIQTLLQGKPVGATQGAIQAVTGATEEFTVGRQKEIFKDIAKALTGIQGQEAKQAVMDIYKAINGQAIKDERLSEIADLLLRETTPAVILAGSRTGSESMMEQR